MDVLIANLKLNRIIPTKENAKDEN
jgi:hypothetical protein